MQYEPIFLGNEPNKEVSKDVDDYREHPESYIEEQCHGMGQLFESLCPGP